MKFQLTAKITIASPRVSRIGLLNDILKFGGKQG